MSTLYLHIGTPKTGTTAIQIFLQKNRKLLKEKKAAIFPVFDYTFTNVRPQRNGHFLSPIVKNPEVKEECFKHLFKVSKRHKKIILSDEGLWNLSEYTEEFWKSLKEILDSQKIDLKVLVYLRRQDSYFLSQWAQKIKGVRHQTYTFQEYLANREDSGLVLDYYSQLSFISEVIGKENVIVRPYEFCQFKNNSIIEDFMETVGIELDDSYLIEEGFRNISVEGNVLEAKRYLNMIPAFIKYSPDLQSSLLEVQSDLRATGKYRNCSTFLNNQRKEFMDIFNPGNEAIAKEYLNKENGILFETPLPTDDPKSSNYSIKELRLIFDLLNEANKNNPSSNLSEDEFKNLSGKAMDIILEEKSFGRKVKRKIKKPLVTAKNKSKTMIKLVKSKIKKVIRK